MHALLPGLLAVFGALVVCASATYTPTIVDHGTPYVIRTFGNTTLHGIPAPGYAKDIFLLDLHGSSRYEMGYAYARLLAHESLASWNDLIASLNFTSLELEVIEAFLDLEWKRYLSQQVPEDFKEELQGLADGGVAAGVKELGVLVTRAITFGNFPGDVSTNIAWLIINELEEKTVLSRACALSLPCSSPTALAIHLTARLAPARMRCSMLGAWGTRTEQGSLYTMRNLDWAANTGIADQKLLTVFHPPGGIAHVTVGFAGLYGALTGMSAAGLTVHEAGLDSRKETFLGFPWVLRLRYIMEKAHNLAEALALWESTNNTLGMNHGIGSAADTAFRVLETRANYTAYFGPMDPREADYMHNSTHLGAPLPDAVWRTNHGYDPDIVKNAIHALPGSDTLTRYFLLHDTLVYYGTSNAIGPLQAVNLTSIVGDKGGSDVPSFLSCAHAQDGENIISVTYHPIDLIAYVAFEEGRDATHVPACCGSYVKIDLSVWLK